MLLALAAGCASPPSTRPQAPPIALPSFRASAVPLFVQTPYLHTWLCGDRLPDEVPKLWNGQLKGMTGIVKIDGKAFRLMGMPTSPLPALKQDSLHILPTRTVFVFSQDDLRLSLEFLSPTDPRDLRLLSLPVGLLRAEVSSATPHAVQLYFDITGEWAVGSSEQRITWDGLFRIRPSQPRLFHETNNYPDWGELHWAPVETATSLYGVHQEVRKSFTDGGSPHRDTRYPRAANDDWPVFAHTWDLGKVQKPVVRRLVLGHVRREIADFYGTPCAAYWTRHYADGAAMIAAVCSEFEAIRERASAVDVEVVSRAHAAGGTALACLASLVFRQAYAGQELALHDGQVFYLSKSMEISGTSATQSLDVLYPASTALLAFNPELLKWELAPIFEALARNDWREPNVMADLGAYPNATGQITTGAARPQATAQLALLSRLAGGPAVPDAFLQQLPDADAFAFLDSSRDRIRVDLLVDRLLNLRRISDDDAVRELARVRSASGKYGTPYELKKTGVRVDALLWIAALGTRAEREAIAGGVLKYYAETPARVPAADRYEPDTVRPAGTQARAVLGAVFAPLLLAPRTN